VNSNHYKRTIAIIYTIVLFLDRLDLTIVNVALPNVAKYFSISIIATDWISLSFLLALAISIPASSWLSDYFGAKKLYICAMALFGLGATLCIFATNFNELVFLRFLQGIGGGLLIPVGMTILYRSYDKSEYASITSFIFLPSLIAPAIAPFVGGLLLTAFGWRMVFVFTGPICLLLAIYSYTYLKEDLYTIKRRFDSLGFLIATFILMNLFYSLSQISRLGLKWHNSLGLILLIPAVWLFLKVEKHSKAPLINLKFFNSKVFVKANLIQLCFQSCHFGAIFLIVLFLQVGAGFSPIRAGLIMGMQAIGAMTTNRYAVRLFHRYGAKVPIIIGFSGIAIFSPIILLINQPSLLFAGMALFFCRGVLSGLCGAPIQTLSIIDFDKSDISVANSIFNACRQISISLGVAISSVLISIGMYLNHVSQIKHTPHNEALNGFSLGFWIIPIIMSIGIIIASRIE
jgi:EmrB/QacA subfamily drug resistance transporter